MFRARRRCRAAKFSALIAANGGDETFATTPPISRHWKGTAGFQLPAGSRPDAPPAAQAGGRGQKLSQVVTEERRLRTEDQPESLTSERFNAAAYLTSPYRHPIIGWMQISRLSPGRSRTGTSNGMRRTMPSWWWSATWTGKPGP